MSANCDQSNCRCLTHRRKGGGGGGGKDYPKIFHITQPFWYVLWPKLANHKCRRTKKRLTNLQRRRRPATKLNDFL